jgi:hypothetical protein
MKQTGLHFENCSSGINTDSLPLVLLGKGQTCVQWLPGKGAFDPNMFLVQNLKGKRKRC